MIEADKLTKYYDKHTAIRDVSFKVEKGEIVGFLGPNGAGKTTTMRILTGFLPPSSGTARVAGYDVLTESLQVRRRIGYLPENVPLYTDMKVTNYLEFVAEVKGVERGNRRHKIGEVMEKCGLAEVRRTLIGALSRGYRQRVGIAQALLNDPEVLILDEPTIGLDPRQIIEIRQLIKALAGQSTIILSTHILPEVSMICHRVIIINNGQVVAVDTPENLTAGLQSSTKLRIRVDGPVDQVGVALTHLPGVLRVVAEDEAHLSACDAQAGETARSFVVESERNCDLRREVSRLIVERGWGLLELRPADMSLEEIFVRLVTKEAQEVRA
ncbi:ABC transporter ATP-binding protein [Candidatus Methylomirabilis sp.]|uniref:ABC transporter ATP-binding protein n=1 Tax=Candidatus Methylomirabilis sp. TaxID=2032687 RepID=UPI003C707E71